MSAASPGDTIYSLIDLSTVAALTGVPAVGALTIASGIVDCDEISARDRAEHGEQYPQHIASARRAHERTQRLLQGQTLIGIEIGLYDVGGLFLFGHGSRRCDTVHAQLTVAYEGVSRFDADLVAARLYPNKRHLRAVVTEKQGSHATLLCRLNPKDRVPLSVSLRWQIDVGSGICAEFGTHFTILPPAESDAVVVSQVSPIASVAAAAEPTVAWQRLHDVYDPTPRMQAYGGETLLRMFDAMNETGGATWEPLVAP